MVNETEIKEPEDKEPKDFYSMVFRRCRKILHNDEDAKEATQEVYAKFYAKEESFEIRPEGFGGLLSTMASNTSFNKLKKDRGYARLLFAEATNVSLNRVNDQLKKDREKDMETSHNWDIASPKVESDGFPDETEQIVDKLFVEALLEEEDEQTRRIYYMRYRDRMKLKEIGEIEELSTAGVHKKLKEFKSTVWEKLGKEQNDGKK